MFFSVFGRCVCKPACEIQLRSVILFSFEESWHFLLPDSSLGTGDPGLLESNFRPGGLGHMSLQRPVCFPSTRSLQSILVGSPGGPQPPSPLLWPWEAVGSPPPRPASQLPPAESANAPPGLNAAQRTDSPLRPPSALAFCLSNASLFCQLPGVFKKGFSLLVSFFVFYSE